MKKIIFFSSSIIFIDTFFFELICKMSTNNQIFIITNTSNIINKYPNNVIIHHLDIKRKTNILSDLSVIVKCLPIVFKIKPSIIISSTPKGGFLINLICLFLPFIKKLHIFTGQIWSNKNYYKRFLLKLIDKFIFFFSNSILVDSLSQKNFLISEGFTNKKISVISNGSIKGVNLNLFKFNFEYRDELRNKLKIDKDTVLLLFIGRLNLEKGINLLLESFSKLIDDKFKIKLLLVGRSEVNINDLVKKHYKQINEHLIILPHSDTIFKFMSAADVFCLPSEREGFGMSVIEASSCNLPVVISNISGLIDTAINNNTGLFFDAKIKNDLYRKLYKLIKDKNLRKQLGSNGRIFVTDKFDHNKVITFLENYILEKINV
tara:strand:- start:424 stop:1551 length:1128 start_codon:yes stop_codon:yes gene_type:complete